MKRRIIFGLLFISVLSAGLFVRLDNITYWKKHPERFYYQDMPLLINQDCFYYLNLARDLQEGTYDKIDTNRAVPQGVARPAIPPLLSVITFAIAKITPYSMDWIAIVLPAFLGLLLAWPVYAIAKAYGDTKTGFIAVLFTLLSCKYVIRSSMGWFDTDCLNVTIVFTFAALMHRFAITNSISRYRYFFAAVICLFLGYWWWGTAIQVVTVAFACPLAVALALYYRPGNIKEKKLFLVSLVSIATILLFWQWRHLYTMFLYIFKIQGSSFPILGTAVGEQRAASLSHIATGTIGSTWSFFLSLAGFTLFLLRWKKESLFLLIPAIIGAMSFNASRFIIFLAPITGLGIAAIAYEIQQRIKNTHRANVALVLLLSFIAWPNLKALDSANAQPPARYPFLHEAMDVLAHKTPPNAVTWVSWGYGHPLVYYTRRGTIADGEIHSGKHMYILSVPMATDNYRVSANWIQFYTEQGMKGLDKVNALTKGDWNHCISFLKSVFAEGPVSGKDVLRQSGLVREDEIDEWLRFLFPVSRRPVYLLLDITNIKLGWFYHGTWDFDKKTGTRFIYKTFTSLQEKPGHIYNNVDIDIDINKGVAKLNNQSYPLSHLLFINQSEQTDYKYDERLNYRFEFNKISHSGALMDKNIAKSVASQLYSQMRYDPRYFTHVYSKLPLYQIWAVKGDTLPERETAIAK